MENNNLQEKRLYRSSTNRVIFGICGGLGEYFNIDPIIFRIIFIVLSFGGGSGIIIYLVFAFLIPKNASSSPTENKSGTINVKEKVDELASELKNFKSPSNHHHGGAFRLLFGSIVVLFGFGLLAQNLNLIPGFHFYLSTLFDFWPVLIILLGLLIISRSKKF